MTVFATSQLNSCFCRKAYAFFLLRDTDSATNITSFFLKKKLIFLPFFKECISQVFNIADVLQWYFLQLNFK